MDKVDRLLKALPPEEAVPGLAASVLAAVHRRHARRLLWRRLAAGLLALLGVWGLWPAVLWLLSNEPFAPGTPWLLTGLEYLDYGPLELLDHAWNNTLSLQGAMGSLLGVSAWLGALLVCVAIFLALEPASWSPPSSRPAPHVSTDFTRSVHI